MGKNCGQFEKIDFIIITNIKIALKLYANYTHIIPPQYVIDYIFSFQSITSHQTILSLQSEIESIEETYKLYIYLYRKLF